MHCTPEQVEEIRHILGRATIDHDRIEIHEPLDRKMYVRVADVLNAIGGTWNKKAQAFLFPDSNPNVSLRPFLVEGAEMPTGPAHVKNSEGYVATPRELAERLVLDHTDIHDSTDQLRVLEPSCGDGALVRVILEFGTDVQVTAIEPNAERARLADADDSRLRLLPGETFESYFNSTTPDSREQFDVVVMNPPFSVPDNKDIWVDHIRMAWEMLAPGGRLAAIVPHNWTFRTQRKYRELREIIEAHGDSHPLGPDAFASAGVKGIFTDFIWLDRPLLCDTVDQRRQARETQALPAAAAAKPVLVSAIRQPAPAAPGKPAQLVLF
jgi:SAM-dependent methyltransferase